MTELDTVAAIGARIDSLGAQWMVAPVMAVGAELGFDGYPWPFYMVGRGGVLGDVDPGEVWSAMVFPSPALVRTAWEEGRAKLTPEAGVSRFIDCAYEWAPGAFGSSPSLDRTVALLEKLAATVDCTSAPLAAGWRAVPAPGGTPERAALAIQILREHRGGLHAAAVIAAGMPPVEAVMATEGEMMATMYGWEGPFPDPETAKAHKAPVEAATNDAVARSYASLTDGEQLELVGLLDGLADAMTGA